MAAPGDVKAWSVDDVCNFLSGLSLENLAPRFRENAVNGSDLTDLTDEELQTELGCTPLQVKKIRKSLGAAQPATAGPPAGGNPTKASYPVVPPGALPGSALPADAAAPAPNPPLVPPGTSPGSAPPADAAAPAPYPPLPDALPPAAAPFYVAGAGGENIVSPAAAIAAAEGAPTAGTTAPAPFAPPAPAASARGDASADVAALRALSAEVAALEARQVEATAAAQQAEAQRAAARLQAAKDAAVQAASDVAKKQQRVDKYSSDGYRPGKPLGKLLGRNKDADKELAEAQAAAKAADARVAELVAAHDRAAAAARDASGEAAKLAQLRARKAEATQRVLAAQITGNVQAAEAARAFDERVAHLYAQHQHATRDADAYNNTARQLQGALGVLQQTTQRLQRGQMSAPAGMVLAAARPGIGGRAPMGMNMVQSANLRQADADVQKACQMIEAAQRAVPDGPLPYIRPATVKGGMNGIFVNMLGAGMISQAMQMQNFRKSMAHVQQMMAEVQQALGWVTPKAQQASMAAAQLAPQLHAAQAQRQELDARLLREAGAA